MAYWRYETKRVGNATEFKRRGSIPLAGGGLIQSAWIERGSPEDVGWTVSAAQMLRSWGWEPATSAIVIDTAPNRDSVSLFQLLAVSGWRESGWSPVLLHLRELWWDEPPRRKSLDGFKRTFVRSDRDGSYVRSTLYLSGSWNWGGNSRSSAALITEPVWDYFANASSHVRKAQGQLALGRDVEL